MARLSLLALLALAGCAGQPIVSKAVCPSVKPFSAAWQHELGQALSALPQNSPIIDMSTDWQRMRDELRACAS